MDERVLLRTRIDELLDKLIVVLAERDKLQEELAYKEHELLNCYESNGLLL